MIPQNVIGTTSYKQTGFCSSQITDNIALDFEKGIITQAICARHSSITDKRKTHAKQATYNTLRSFFISLFKKLLAQPALFRRKIYQFLIIKVNSQTGGQLLAYFFSAASQLTTDINNIITVHNTFCLEASPQPSP